MNSPWATLRDSVRDESRLCVSTRHLAAHGVNKHVHVVAVRCSCIRVCGKHGRSPRRCHPSVGRRRPHDGAGAEGKSAAMRPCPSLQGGIGRVSQREHRWCCQQPNTHAHVSCSCCIATSMLFLFSVMEECKRFLHMQ